MCRCLFLSVHVHVRWFMCRCLCLTVHACMRMLSSLSVCLFLCPCVYACVRWDMSPCSRLSACVNVHACLCHCVCPGAGVHVHESARLHHEVTPSPLSRSLLRRKTRYGTLETQMTTSRVVQTCLSALPPGHTTRISGLLSTLVLAFPFLASGRGIQTSLTGGTVEAAIWNTITRKSCG